MALPSCIGSDVGSVLHPFFIRSAGEYGNSSSIAVPEQQQTTQRTEYYEPQPMTNDDRQHASHDGSTSSTTPPTTAPRNFNASRKVKSQTTLSKAFKIELPETHIAQSLPSTYDGAHEDDNAPRKRRKTSLDTSVKDDVVTTSFEQQVTNEQMDDQGGRFSTHNEIGATETASRQIQTPPKKMLRLSASGKFSSPPIRAAKEEATLETQPRKRGRPRKSKEMQAPKQQIVKMSYKLAPPSDDRSTMAEKIDDILEGRLSIQLASKTPKKTRTPRKSAKLTHPFFSDKPKPIQLQKPESPRKTAAITPGKLRAQTKPDTLRNDDEYIYESALLKDRHMTKHPGAQDPLWPPRGMTRVHPHDIHTIPLRPLTANRRKLKSINRPIAAEDSLLMKYARQLQPEQDSTVRPDGYAEPSPGLLIPDQLLISGAEICNEVLRQVVAPIRSGPADELSSEPSSQACVHPALTHVATSISSYLSGFDELRGETAGWAAKHAPVCAADILQPTSETTVLKTWLQSMIVNSVGGLQVEMQQEQIKPKRKKKRKARHDELDDFIVDEEDDTRSMITLSDAESTSGLRSVVQTQVKGVRANNVLLISGPHGCGKTAAVYAVAKELNYRVFEISSAERRTGKDVLDKIGNVTENHMVKQPANDSEVEKVKVEESERIDAAFNKDLESGRQGKMSAFFKSKPNSKASSKTTSTNPKATLLKKVHKTVKKSVKEQQQSLILLEEVDILFKDDKEFWNTVLRLMLSSKRPFILTCNDEDLVPIQTLDLHAILRFAAPASDLAIDYLLLVAAKEGHLLQRNVVASLWQSSGYDLRKSLATLDFWCRMGVGDIRDGLSWIYQRWPIGGDIDAKGRQLRVVSHGTFHAGLQKASPSTSAEHSVWSTLSISQADSVASLMSDIDVLSGQSELDVSLPDMPAKQRTQYIEGMQLLDPKECTDYTCLSAQIESCVTSLAQQSAMLSTIEVRTAHPSLPRKAFAAFDGLANPVHSSSTPTGMETSVFDGPLGAIAVDVAPYARQILRHDLLLEEQRNAMAGPGKQARKTRAAMSALEGGQRQLVRRQWWWEGVGDLCPILATAGESWGDVERAAMHLARAEIESAMPQAFALS